jgi:hypothetical protein
VTELVKITIALLHWQSIGQGMMLVLVLGHIVGLLMDQIISWWKKTVFVSPLIASNIPQPFLLSL